MRVAVIGLGYWGPNLVRNFYAILGNNLCVCCDIDPERTQAIRQAYPSVRITNNPEDVFADPDIDAVAIATPVHTHYELASAAIKAGKAVLVEMPMCRSLENAEKLVALANERNAILMVDHVFLYSPPVRRMKEIVDAGDLGDLLFIDCVRINLGLFKHDVNVAWSLAPHDLSIVDHMVGRLPNAVSAFGASHTSNGVEDVAYLNLDYGNDLIANFHVNWLSPTKIRYAMIGGSKKSLIYNDLDPAERLKVYDRGIRIREDDLEGRRRTLVDHRTGDVWCPHVPRVEPLKRVTAHFIDCVQNQKQPLTDGKAGLRIVRILEAAERSIKARGSRVTIET